MLVEQLVAGNPGRHVAERGRIGRVALLPPPPSGEHILVGAARQNRDGVVAAQQRARAGRDNGVEPLAGKPGFPVWHRHPCRGVRVAGDNVVFARRRESQHAARDRDFDRASRIEFRQPHAESSAAQRDRGPGVVQLDDFGLGAARDRDKIGADPQHRPRLGAGTHRHASGDRVVSIGLATMRPPATRHPPRRLPGGVSRPRLRRRLTRRPGLAPDHRPRMQLRRSATAEARSKKEFVPRPSADHSIRRGRR